MLILKRTKRKQLKDVALDADYTLAEVVRWIDQALLEGTVLVLAGHVRQLTFRPADYTTIYVVEQEALPIKR